MFWLCGLFEGGEGAPFGKGAPSPPSSSLLSLPKTFIWGIGQPDNTGNVRVSTVPRLLGEGEILFHVRMRFCGLSADVTHREVSTSF